MLLIALTTPFVFAQDDAIMAREEVVRKAIVNEDARALAPVLTEDFVAIWPDATRASRQEQLDLLGKGWTADEITISDVQVRTYGDTAVVTGRWGVKAIWDGKRVTNARAYTHIWVKQNGEWKLASRHLSALP